MRSPARTVAKRDGCVELHCETVILGELVDDLAHCHFEGAIEVTVGKVTHELRKDDCLAMQLDAPVTFRNRTRRTANYIVVLAS